MTAVTRGRSGGVRTYVLDLPDQPHLSANSRNHWRERHARAHAWREAVAWLAKAEAIPAMEAVVVTLHVTPPDRRRRDPDNTFPAVKHCTDGLVDAGVLADDDMTRVRHVGITPHPPDGSKRWRWRLEVADAADG